MKNKTKYLLIGTVLLTAAAGSVIAFGGPGKCNQGEGYGKFGQMQGKHQRGHMQGINRLTDLTDQQKEQLSELRHTQQELMRGKRAERVAQRELMKQKVDAILTVEQRETLENMDISNFGHHPRRGYFGG